MGDFLDWTHFEFDYRLEHDPEWIGQLIAIEASREAAQNLVLPANWREQLDKLNRVRAVYGTTALEGNPLPEEEVSRQLDLLGQTGAMPQEIKGLNKEQLQIRNAGMAQEWTRQRFSPGGRPLAFDDVLEMHLRTTEHSDTANNAPGRLREHEVTVGSPDMGGVHRGAPHQQLSRLMDEYVAFANSPKMLAEHPVVRALIAHFFLVTIHPFGDGNGRVSRLVEAGVLFQGGYNVHGFYGLSNYFYRNERDYKTLLQECRQQLPFNLTPFVVFGLKGFAAELKGINNFIKTKLNRVIYRQMLVRAYNKRVGKRRRVLNNREYQLLQFLINETEPTDPFSEQPSRKLDQAELIRAPYVQAAYRSVTQRTFLRELTRLGEMGFIKYTTSEPGKPIVELDFEAIGRY